MTNAAALEKAYRHAGQDAVVREIGSGRYEIIRPRLRQTISHRELTDEIARLNARVITPGGSVECPYCHWGIAPSAIDQHIREKH